MVRYCCGGAHALAPLLDSSCAGSRVLRGADSWWRTNWIELAQSGRREDALPSVAAFRARDSDSEFVIKGGIWEICARAAESRKRYGGGLAVWHIYGAARRDDRKNQWASCPASPRRTTAPRVGPCS